MRRLEMPLDRNVIALGGRSPSVVGAADDPNANQP
jgi:hypothetical protein